MRGIDEFLSPIGAKIAEIRSIANILRFENLRVDILKEFSGFPLENLGRHSPFRQDIVIHFRHSILLSSHFLTP